LEKEKKEEKITLVVAYKRVLFGLSKRNEPKKQKKTLEVVLSYFGNRL